MWVVVKYKIHEINLLKCCLTQLFGDEPSYFQPRIRIQKFIKNKLKTFDKPILDNYLIFYHKKLSDNFFQNKLRYIKGLLKILDLTRSSQKDLVEFIINCKKFEGKDGYIKQDFFNNKYFSEAKFISGPFNNIFFKIISKKKKELNLLIGNIKASIKKKNTDCFFQSV